MPQNHQVVFRGAGVLRDEAFAGVGQQSGHDGFMRVAPWAQRSLIMSTAWAGGKHELAQPRQELGFD